MFLSAGSVDNLLGYHKKPVNSSLKEKTKFELGIKVGRYLTREIAEKSSCCLFFIQLGIRVPQSVLFVFQ